MNCHRCLTQNDENARFCKNCGTDMHHFQETTTNSKTPDLLILLFLIIMFVCDIARFAIQTLVTNWYEGTSKYIIIGLNLIGGIAVILAGISIRNKTSKIFGIIIASLYILYIIYANISWLIR